MQGNQAVELSALEKALSTALEVHQHLDRCWGVLSYVSFTAMSLVPAVVFKCRKCGCIIAIGYETQD